MKNTYKIPEGCTSISIEQIGNKIVTEFETEFKKGDIILKKYIGSFNYILILDYIDKNGRIYYLAYIRQGDIRAKIKSDFGLGCEGDANTSLCLATQSEKQLLFDALSKVSKKWNAETLQIEDLKVDPKVGDCVKIGSAYCIVGQVCGDAFSEKNEWIRFEWDGYKIKQKSYIKFTKYADIAILTPPQFQSEVNALGFEYDFKNDTFKELRWVPKEGDRCFELSIFLNELCVVEIIYASRYHKKTYDEGRTFKTKSECESVIEKIKNVLKSK